MANIIKRAERKVVVEFSRVFNRTDSPGSGFSFPCDEQGNVKVEQLHPLARANYNDCVAGKFPVIDDGVRRYEHRYTEPAVLKCDCKATVALDGFTSTCDRCGADYNMSGQRLAPRSQWGEETGESLSDILRIP